MNPPLPTCVYATAIRAAVSEVHDPELAGVTIGSLGMVRQVQVGDDGVVSVELVPTFLGCPALRHIAGDVEAAARRAGASRVDVRFDHRTPWTTEQVTDTARSQLADLGIAVAVGQSVTCPFCYATTLEPVSAVGPAACRSAHWCTSCRNIVEVFRDSTDGPASLPFPTRRDSYAHL